MDDVIGMLSYSEKIGLNLPKAPKNIDDNEWAARLDLAACYRMVAHYGQQHWGSDALR